MGTAPPRQQIAQRIREARDTIEELDDTNLIDDLILVALSFAETYYS